MKGKHTSVFKYLAALAYRERLRWKIRRLVRWERLEAPESGCTAVIGVCSRLPEVLAANLRCLHTSRWPALKRVLAVVDGAESSLPQGLEKRVCEAYPELNIKFLHYSEMQAGMAEEIKLPYVYAWMSWCIGIRHVTTQHVLIHDYDALILGRTLQERYASFAASNTRVQGISWYQVNGVEVGDHLATTFEAFFDAAWLRSTEPIELFNKLRLKAGRSIDFDITLDAQDRLLKSEQRTIMPMNLDELVHPSQMIHQYTMFRRSPNAPQPCFSIPMIPFFAYLSGNSGAIERATQAVHEGSRSNLDLIGDGTRINLALLDIKQVDWALKQMVQAMVSLGIAPDPIIHRYGSALYRVVGASEDSVWRGDFTALQRQWIASSAAAA